MVKKKILIIGAAGNVCLEVLNRLKIEDVEIRVAARNPERAQSLIEKDTEVVAFDYYRPETFSNVVKGIDRMLLVSPPAHLKLQQHVKMVIDQARKQGVKHIVNISGFEIQDDAHPMRIIEDYIEKSGMDYSFLRPNCYMQYFSTYFRQSIIDEGLIKMPAQNARTSFVDMRDVADAAKILLLKDNLDSTTYTLTGKKALNLHDVADILSDVLGRNIQYQEISEEEYKRYLKLGGWMDASIDASISLCRVVKLGWNAVITSGLPIILQREPRSFRDFAVDYAECWNEPVAVI
jgi:uncharacterized protein YbjT (DUF2867 family)